MVIQGLVILFAGALENLFRPRIEALFRRTAAAGPLGGDDAMDYLTLLSVLDGTLRTAAPLVLAALAGLFAERSRRGRYRA